jgi:tripeptide aminopeptidase
VRLARQALEAAGITAREEEVGGGADAHIFNGRGLECVVLTSGMERIHGPGERILAADVDRLSDITVELVAAARASSHGRRRSSVSSPRSRPTSTASP